MDKRTVKEKMEKVPAAGKVVSHNRATVNIVALRYL